MSADQSNTRCVLQDWVMQLPMMQQTVLLTAIRGPDGLSKYGPYKKLLRWFRRCVLLSAIDGKVLDNPYDTNGGSFTGPSIEGPEINRVNWESPMDSVVDEYMQELDAIPHHFHLHLLHGVEIIGFKHPDPGIAIWWLELYRRFVNDLHLHPETEAELDARLGDTREGWAKRADPATMS